MKDIKAYLPIEARQHFILAFHYGSYVYGTNSDTSDQDIIAIVDDNLDLSKYTNNIWEYRNDIYDFQIINENMYIDMIDKHHIIALESMFMKPELYSDYNEFTNRYMHIFKLDKWKLRTTISSICSNSYAKCHKKLVVPESYDVYCAQKSIFHCIRLYMFGIDISTMGGITNYGCANHYWDEIKVMGDNWEEYKDKYKPLLNKLKSEMVYYCPKPIDN